MELIKGLETRQLWIAPLSGGERPVPAAHWIRASDVKSIDRQLSLSEDGASLYYVSNRDGYQCLWMQPLNPQTKPPVADPRPVRHFHSAALGFQTGDSGFFGLSIGGGEMVISLGASTGNIWLLKRP